MDVGQSPTEPLELRLLWPDLEPHAPDQPLDDESAVIAERRAKVFRLYTRGLNIRQIAEHEGVRTSKSTVGRDVQHVMESYRQLALKDAAVHVALQLARLAVLEAQAFEAWELSKGAQLEESHSERGEFKSSSRKTRQRDGNPRYLALAMGCWDRRCRLLGLLKAEDFKSSSNLPPVKLVAGLDPAELV